jgi:hypothetical protein
MPWNKVCVAVAALLWVPTLAAQKADTVVLRNGDRITGEIKQLDRGSLSYSTDDMGTIAIEWAHVMRITSRRFFEVEVASGQRFFGSLGPAPSAEQIVVAVAEFSDTLDQATVVRLYPIGASFVSRIDGRIDVGLSLRSANDVRELNVAAEAQHRTRKWLTRLQGNVYFQDQAGVDGTSRNSAQFRVQRFFGRRWSGIGSAKVEQNEELQLNRRILIAAGVGRFLVQTNYTLVAVAAGLTFSDERYEATAPTQNVEGLLGGEFDYFRLDGRETDVRITLTAYPSLTDFGRIRIDFDARASRELVKDFTMSLTFFDTYDSRPPQGAVQNDLGATLALGWKF